MSEEARNQTNTPTAEVADPVRNSSGKSRVKAAFVEWLALPEALRAPKTAREFANENGVSERTLYRWRTSDDVQKRVRDLVNSRSRARYGEVADAIITSAVSGDVSAQKLYLQHFIPEGDAAPERREIRVKFGDEDEDLVPFFARKENQPSEN